MNLPSRQPILASLLVLLLALLACQTPQSTSSTPTSLPITPPAAGVSSAVIPTIPPVPPPSPTARPSSPQAETTHRIATHRIYGIAGFYDQQTSLSFVPRGVNYFILLPVSDHYENRLFGLGVYDHNRTLRDFTALSKAGYNTVRITLDGCTSGDGCIGLENDQGLNPTYLDNIVDLMKLAKETDLFLLLASENLPELGGYAANASQGSDPAFAPGRNAEYLTSDGIQAAQQYWTDLLTGLITPGCALRYCPRLGAARRAVLPVRPATLLAGGGIGYHCQWQDIRFIRF